VQSINDTPHHDAWQVIATPSPTPPPWSMGVMADHHAFSPLSTSHHPCQILQKSTRIRVECPMIRC